MREVGFYFWLRLIAESMTERSLNFLGFLGDSGERLLPSRIV